MGLGPGLRPSGPRAVPSTILCPLPDSPMNVRSSTHLIRAFIDASRQRRSPERDQQYQPTIGASGRKLASSNVYKRKGRTPTLDQPNLKTTPLHALHQEIGSAAESTNGLGLKETFATVGSLPLPKDTRPLPKDTRPLPKDTSEGASPLGKSALPESSWRRHSIVPEQKWARLKGALGPETGPRRGYLELSLRRCDSPPRGEIPREGEGIAAFVVP